MMKQGPTHLMQPKTIWPRRSMLTLPRGSWLIPNVRTGRSLTSPDTLSRRNFPYYEADSASVSSQYLHIPVSEPVMMARLNKLSRRSITIICAMNLCIIVMEACRKSFSVEVCQQADERLPLGKEPGGPELSEGLTLVGCLRRYVRSETIGKWSCNK